MSTKKFLTPFAVLAATFSCEQAIAVPVQPADSSEQIKALPQSDSNKTFAFNLQGNEHNFILKRSSETGTLMAWHESHASHSSHRSHYSSRY